MGLAARLAGAIGGSLGSSGRALLTLFAGATAIGFSAIFVRHADVGPAAIGFWRMAFALPLVALWAWRDHDAAAPPASRAAWLWASAAGGAFAIDVVLFHVAVDLTTVAKASLLGNAAPLILAAVGIVLLGDRPSRAVRVALVISALGVALLMKPDAAPVKPAAWLGDLAALGAALSYAAYLVAIQQARGTGSSAFISLTSTAICGVCCLAMALGFGEAILPRSTAGWLAVAALGVISHALGQGLITVGLGKVGPSVAAVVLVYPAIVSTMAGAAIFGEIPTLVQMAGGAMILAALILARRG